MERVHCVIVRIGLTFGSKASVVLSLGEGLKGLVALGHIPDMIILLFGKILFIFKDLVQLSRVTVILWGSSISIKQISCLNVNRTKGGKTSTKLYISTQPLTHLFNSDSKPTCHTDKLSVTMRIRLNLFLCLLTYPFLSFLWFGKYFLTLGHDIFLLDTLELLLHVLELKEHFTLGSERLAVGIVFIGVESRGHIKYQ